MTVYNDDLDAWDPKPGSKLYQNAALPTNERHNQRHKRRQPETCPLGWKPAPPSPVDVLCGGAVHRPASIQALPCESLGLLESRGHESLPLPGGAGAWQSG